MSVDVKLNSDWELIPVQQYVGIQTAAARQSTHLAEHTEQQALNSGQMDQATVNATNNHSYKADPQAIESRGNRKYLCAHRARHQPHMTSVQVLPQRPTLHKGP